MEDCSAMYKYWATGPLLYRQETLVKVLTLPGHVFSNRVASRWDCGTIYHLDVQLKASDRKTVIDSCHLEKQEDQWAGKQWTQVQWIYM